MHFWEPGKIVLAVSDSGFRAETKNLLEQGGHRVLEARDGAQALWVLSDHRNVEMVLSELKMPVLDGAGLLRGMRNSPDLASIPVIILGDHKENQGILQCLGAGATDFIKRPFDPEELLIRVRNNLALFRTMKNLSELAQADDLTGLYNRRYLFDILFNEMERSRRTMEPLGIILANLDHLDSIIQKWGPMVGDQMIKFFAQKVMQQIRPYDKAARYDSSRIVIVSPSQDSMGLMALAERLRLAMEEPAPTQAGETPGFISLGAALLDPLHKETDLNFLSRAEQAQLLARQQGGNQTIMADPED